MSLALSNDHWKELGQRRVKTGPVLEINEIAGILCYTIVISEKKLSKKIT